MSRETVAVLDFETTGLSPNCGDRATEIAITLVRDGQVIDRYQSLMNAGRRIPSEVTYITGINSGMLASCFVSSPRTGSCAGATAADGHRLNGPWECADA